MRLFPLPTNPGHNRERNDHACFRSGPQGGNHLKARSLGFTLADIQALADASREGETPCGQVRTLIETRLEQVERQIAELQSLSLRMRSAMEQWQGSPDCRLDDGRVCGLIDTFVDAPDPAG